MVLDSKRDKAEPVLEPVARAMVRVDPHLISLAAIILAFFAGACIYLSPDNWRYLLPLASLLVIASGFLDALDGKVARLAGKAEKRGDFLDHVLDRYADVFMIGAVAISAWCDPIIGLLAVVGVLLTSYMGTQAQAVGAGRLYSGLLGRADRVVLLFVAPLIQWSLMFHGDGWIDTGVVQLSIMEMMMIWFAVVGNLTAVQRAVSTWRDLGE